MKKALVVDDSAVSRRILSFLLQRGGYRVEAAQDPIFAQEKLLRFRPDVIVLDLEMPRMDGVTFLRRVMHENPVPVVICSALTDEAGVAFEAMKVGAAAIVTKPRIGLAEFLEDSGEQILATVAEAVLSKGRFRKGAEELARAAHPSRLRITTDKIVAVGASTGGTEAIRYILESLPPEAPGLVIVQHMPEHFTAMFSARLDALCGIRVQEARDGDWIAPGKALIAPGNRHTEVIRSGGHYAVRVYQGPLVSRHRPSVDVLFKSVAAGAGANAVGVILTGMGNDGAEGMLAMSRAGAVTIAQDEASSVVYGMPREAVELGAVDQIVPLSRIPHAILRAVASGPTAT